VQADLLVRRGGAREHRADEARIELVQQFHRIECRAALLRDRVRVLVRDEQPLVLDERRFDLGILRERRVFADAEAFRRLALREQVVVHAVLEHDARGLLGERAAHVVATNGAQSSHRRPPAMSRPQVALRSSRASRL